LTLVVCLFLLLHTFVSCNITFCQIWWLVICKSIYNNVEYCAVFAARCHASVAYAIMQCVSVMFVHSVKMSNCIYKIFSLSGSQTILVFHTNLHGNILMGSPLTGASNAGGIGTDRDFGRRAGYGSMTAGRAGTKCDTLSCDGPCRVYDTSCW